MKPNLERKWHIQLLGEGHNCHTVIFDGTIDEALAAADEEDSEVDWPVIGVSVVAQRTFPINGVY